MKKNILKCITGILVCVTTVAVGNNCYEHFVKNTTEETNEPIIINAVSRYDTLYDYADNNVIKEDSDLVVVGKVTEIGTPSNYNPITGEYHRTYTPCKLEVTRIVKSDGDNDLTEVNFLNFGGTISYEEYAKSLLPVQREKREYLMKQSGIKTTSNILVNERVENQLDLEVGKYYIMYLYYDSKFDNYVVVNQPYGVKEFNVKTQEVINHVTKEVAKLDELM